MLKHGMKSPQSAKKLLTAQFNAASRQMLERLFNAPKGFGKFYPPGSNSAGSGAGNASKTATGAAKKAQPTSGGGSGGGGRNPAPLPDVQIPIAISAGLLLYGGLYLALSTKQGDEISMQEFQSQLLEEGKVDRIMIVNKTIARVVLKEGIPSNLMSTSGSDTMATKDDGTRKDAQHSSIVIFSIDFNEISSILQCVIRALTTEFNMLN